MRYDVQIERDESGAWLARVPSVPGCHTYGRSLRQVRHRIGEALGLWIDDADQAELAFHYHLPSAIRSELARARAARQRAAAAGGASVWDSRVLWRTPTKLPSRPGPAEELPGACRRMRSNWRDRGCRQRSS